MANGVNPHIEQPLSHDNKQRECPTDQMCGMKKTDMYIYSMPQCVWVQELQEQRELGLGKETTKIIQTIQTNSRCIKERYHTEYCAI